MKNKRIDDLHIIDEKSGKVITDKWNESENKKEEAIRLVNSFTDEFLDIMDKDYMEELSYSDLQGIIRGLVVKILEKGKNL